MSRPPTDPAAGDRSRDPGLAVPLVYLYCLLQAPSEPPVDDAPPGLPETSEPGLLAVDEGLWLVRAHASGELYAAPAVEERLQDLEWVSACALAHEAVVEHFAGAGAVVPMKLFSLFSSDERALAHVRARRPELDRILGRIAGCREWGVRIRLDEAGARRELAEALREEAADVPPGKAFLLRKKALRRATHDLGRDLRAAAETVFAELAQHAAAVRRREPERAERGPLLEAAFLVPETAEESFERALEESSRRLAERSGEVTLTGPWPPYSFVGEEG